MGSAASTLSPDDGKTAQSSSSPTRTNLQSETRTFLVDLSVPMGLRIGTCHIGTYIGEIEPDSAAEAWNKHCESNAFDADRKINIGDIFVAIKNHRGQMENVHGCPYEDVEAKIRRHCTPGEKIHLQLRRMNEEEKAVFARDMGKYYSKNRANTNENAAAFLNNYANIDGSVQNPPGPSSSSSSSSSSSVSNQSALAVHHQRPSRDILSNEMKLMLPALPPRLKFRRQSEIKGSHVFTASLPQPLGLKITASPWGNIITSLLPQAKKYNQSVTELEEVEPKDQNHPDPLSCKIRTGDVILSITDRHGVSTSFAAKTPEEVLGFVKYKCDPTRVELQLAHMDSGSGGWDRFVRWAMSNNPQTAILQLKTSQSERYDQKTSGVAGTGLNLYQTMHGMMITSVLPGSSADNWNQQTKQAHARLYPGSIITELAVGNAPGDRGESGQGYNQSGQDRIPHRTLITPKFDIDAIKSFVDSYCSDSIDIVTRLPNETEIEAFRTLKGSDCPWNQSGNPEEFFRQPLSSFDISNFWFSSRIVI